MVKAIKNVDEDTESVMVFGHNPTWSDLAERLTGEYFSMKTADVAVLEFDGKWKKLQDGKCRTVHYLSPKEL